MSGTATGEEITDDGFLDGRLKVLQPAKGYRAGLDAVLLAAAVPERSRIAVTLPRSYGTNEDDVLLTLKSGK